MNSKTRNWKAAFSSPFVMPFLIAGSIGEGYRFHASDRNVLAIMYFLFGGAFAFLILKLMYGAFRKKIG